jgi:hypothetical protein
MSQPRASAAPSQDVDRSETTAVSRPSSRWMWAKGCASLLVAGAMLTSCGLFRGAINSSPGLRWWLFSSFGANKLCPEMLRRGTPLRLTPNGNVIGRFFPSTCQNLVDQASQTITIRFGGTGYGWTPLAGRIGFAASAAVEYRPDFFLDDDAMYVWARTNRIVATPEFQIGSSESPIVNAAAQSPVGYLANIFGGQIMGGQLASGFTVVRTEDGDDFTLGILQPPARPQHPFNASDDERYVFVNETAEIRAEQIDFVGPIQVPQQGQALYIRYRRQGPAAEALVYDRRVADYWRDTLQRGALLAPPQQPPIASLPLTASEAEHKLRLPAGEYMIVIDNSSRVGTVRPPWNPLSTVGVNTLFLSYRVELGEAD